MLPSQYSTMSPPVSVDSMETLCDFLDDLYTSNYLAINNNELEESTIHRIYTDLTTVENLTNDEYVSLLHLVNEDIPTAEMIVSENIFTSIRSDDSQSSVRSNTPISSDNDDKEQFNPKEWLVRDASSRQIRQPKLYEFLHRLLDNSRYNSYASWLNKDEGLFKIHKPAHAANLWKQVKRRRTNGSMDYDTFARGIRYYYKSGSMIKTHTKHTYCFATNYHL
ncbi:unnamed protein product [Adineta steineri]|uniref:ETS domain-containing protein n=1 Tax=Adineta steineri TaxID=433720 RepID=A0A813ZF78_9BILA|nr:unnamed protein product [Adineta steineri]CAF3636120.1 unnamed protein product [Adineta steineri]CAF3828822.1 unnamed protein product [Adineta steineri]